MCLEAMDAKKTHVKTDYLRKTMKFGSSLNLFRVSPEDTEALKRCGAVTVRATIRRHLRREKRRLQLVKLSKVLGDIRERDQRDTVCEESPAAACLYRQPPGAMAPENTTQYLMGNAYEDMKTRETIPAAHATSAHLYSECLSPRSVSAALDSDESCLDFQQRDFEEMYDQWWQLE